MTNNPWETFKFGVFLGLGLMIAYVVMQILAWVFATAASGGFKAPHAALDIVQRLVA